MKPRLLPLALTLGLGCFTLAAQTANQAPAPT